VYSKHLRSSQAVLAEQRSNSRARDYSILILRSPTAIEPIPRRFHALRSEYEPPTRVDPGGCAAIHFGSFLDLLLDLLHFYTGLHALNH
jgi:hypothetical protein